MKYAELAQAQANILIELMKEGKPFLPFLKPGDPATVNNLPYNPTTGKAYRGGNRVMLWIVSMIEGYTDNRWVTYKQALAVGAQVKKGAKSIQLRRTIFPDGSEADSAAVVQPWMDKPRTFFFNVFNAEQVEGLPPPPLRPETTPHQRIERCEQLVKDSGAVVVHGSNNPHYAPKADKIGMPYPERFVDSQNYYAALTHELAHWSGHESRLNRDLSGAYGSESYAREELIAEVASHVLGVELGIGHDPSQHAAYLHHWMTIAQADPSFLYTAASAAEKICDFVGLERYAFEPLPTLEPVTDIEVDAAVLSRVPSMESATRKVLEPEREMVL